MRLTKGVEKTADVKERLYVFFKFLIKKRVLTLFFQRFLLIKNVEKQFQLYTDMQLKETVLFFDVWTEH